MKIKSNLLSGIIAILFAIALLLVIPSQIHTIHQTNEYLGSGFVPKLIAYVILASGVIMLIKSLLLRQEQEVVINLAIEKTALIFYAVMVAYLLLIPPLGFVAASLCVGVAALAYQRVRNVTQYVVVLAIIAGVYFAFVHCLDVPLP